MTHQLSHENSGSGNSVDRGQLLLAALIALALLASVIMLLTDSAGALKIALLAALWAAIIGFFLVYRSQKKVEASERELQALDSAHHSELERRAAVAEAERLEQEIGHQRKLNEQDDATLQQIREQLAEMRTQLEELSGREWSYEPTMLHAEARRIMELESEQYRLQHSESTPEVEPVLEVVVPEEPRQSTRAPEPAAEAEPVVETAQPVKHRAAEDREEAPARHAERIPGQDTVPATGEAPEDTPAETRPGRRSRHAAPEDAGGRRRKDERQGGLSVAELLASARKREQS